MKVIAVSQRMDMFSEIGEMRDTLDQRLIAFLRDAGYLPVPVPNGLYMEISGGPSTQEILGKWVVAVSPAGIVISGGNDIGQFISRDLTESWLLDYAHTRRLPVLGICRGMQILAHWAGTLLHPVTGHVRTRHQLSGVINAEVNSYHRMAIDRCPQGFEVLAKSKDGEIEAIRHLTLPWEGWMWHPERELPFVQHDLQRVKVLFQ